MPIRPFDDLLQPMIHPPLLYTYRRCPYAMRARMALLLGGHAFDAFEIVLSDKPTALLPKCAESPGVQAGDE